MCQRLAIILVILIAISTLVIHASASNDGIAFGKLETGWLHGFRAPFYGAANVTTYGGTFHSGIHEFVRDITPNTGAEYYDVEIWNGDVLASGDGTVIFADTYAVTGCEVAGKPSTVTSSVVVVEHVVAPGSGEHAQRFFSVYEHVENWVVESGDIVYAGQKLASMGNTGCSTGPHLHFGLYADTNSKPQWGSHYRTATTISVNMNWTWEPAAGLEGVMDFQRAAT